MKKMKRKFTPWRMYFGNVGERVQMVRARTKREATVKLERAFIGDISFEEVAAQATRGGHLHIERVRIAQLRIQSNAMKKIFDDASRSVWL